MGMILWTQSDSGGSDGRLVRLFRQATAASAARSLRQDQGCAAILEGRLSAARGVVPGGVRDDRERRRLRRHRRLGQGASVVPARLRRVPSRHSLRRLAALRHEPHQPRPVHGLLFVMGRGPDKLDLVAIDGKTSRRSHNRKTGHKALHLVSAFATNTRLVLGQEAVDEKSNEVTAIPALVERLELDGALVSIDAMGCNPTIAGSILDAKADYLLAVKDNQPTLHADIESYFETAPPNEVEKVETLDKDHGRFEVRNHSVSQVVDWYAAQRSYPGAPRFPQLTTIAMVESRT